MKKLARKVGTQQQQAIQVGNDENRKHPKYADQIVVLYRGVSLKDASLINRLSQGGEIFTFKPAADNKGVNVNDGDDKKGSFLLEFIVNADKREEFKALLPKMVEIMRNSKNHKYSEEFLDNFEQNIINKVDSLPTIEDLQNSREKMTKNWKELVSKLNDPEFRSKIIRYAFSENGEVKEVELSPKNAREILLQNPSATFVTDIPTWANMFKRRVVNLENKIIVTKPLNTWVNKQKRNEASMELYHVSFDELMAKCNSVEEKNQYKHGIDKYITRKEGRILYYKTVVYDIADTEPIDQNEDPFAASPVKNNIPGSANSPYATNNPNASAGNTGDVEARIGISGAYLEKYKEWLYKKCTASKVDVSNYLKLPSEECVTRLIYAYAYENADEQGQVTGEDRNAFATAVLLGVCAVLGLRTNFTNMTISDELARLSWPVFIELSSPPADIYNDITPQTQDQTQQDGEDNYAPVKMVSENTSTSFEDYINILKSKGVKIRSAREQVTESFFSLLIRMDNSKRNLLF